MNQFDHERFDVYRAAIEFVGVANQIVEQLPRGRSHLADQLNRAATSIVLNIAEGAGEFSSKDKVRFYRMAKRSATECAAVLDVIGHLGLLTDQALLAPGRTLLLRVVAMIIRMAQAAERSGRRQEAQGTGTGAGTGTNIAEAEPRYAVTAFDEPPHEFIG